MSLELTLAEVDIVPPATDHPPALGEGTLYIMAAACGTALGGTAINAAG